MRIVFCAFLLLIVGVGCVEIPLVPKQEGSAPTAKTDRPRTRVTADQVKESNAHQIADKLQEELDGTEEE